MHLFAVLNQNVIEFHHHLIVERFSGADVLELQQYFEGHGCRAQALEGLVNEVNGFSFNLLDQRRYNMVKQSETNQTNPFHMEIYS